MAIDSAQKRFGMHGLHFYHVAGAYPSVSGIVAAERAVFANMYGGIALDEPEVLPGPRVPDFTTQDWRALVISHEPDHYEKEVVYEFSNGRQFQRP
jgi:hypothetical protein